MYEWRRYDGPLDLREMQTLVSQSWAMEKPHVNVHVGDLEWWATQQSDEPDLTSIWYSEDELVGWAWLSPPAELDVHLHPDHRRGPLYELMLDWFETSASSRPAPPDEAIAFLFEPARERVELMESRGYRPTENGYIHNVRSLMNGLPEPTVPDGFSLRHVQGPEDIEQRVAVHRSAFAPSRMTSDRYRTVMASAHYRPDLDWVAVAPGGEFASFCNIWLDRENAVALLEPVGTADGYRKLGLGRATCLAAMAAAAREGADTAIVLTSSGNAASLALYRSLGFERFGSTHRFLKRLT